ncbi:MAG: outer membrane lipoprotein carrier protein LolA [Acidobacteria bacterium]|nr:outer membrane lipoprotein carrier protein LolA [Acidobacteriota bacterium]
MRTVSQISRLAILAGLFLCCLPVAAQPPFQDALLDTIAGLQRRYASVRTVTGQFEQRYRAPGVDQVESGTFWMKKPGLMRWEYNRPETKLFIADGRETFLYVPEDGQVMVRSFTDSDLRGTPLQFLLGRGDILRSFAVAPESEFKARAEGTVLVRLSPYGLDQEYTFLVLEIDLRTHDLRRIVIRERTGNTSEFLLTDLRTGLRIDDSRFRFRMPKGVEVIRLDEK